MEVDNNQFPLVEENMVSANISDLTRAKVKMNI